MAGLVCEKRRSLSRSTQPRAAAWSMDSFLARWRAVVLRMLCRGAYARYLAPPLGPSDLLGFRGSEVC
jgi:hypothetical protein